MSDSLLDLPATPARLRALADAGVIDPAVATDALATVEATPPLAGWRRFASWVLGVFGTLLVLAGVVFFFAANWQDLGRFAKFGLLEVALVACALAAAWRGLGPLSGRLALVAAMVLLGPLLAVFGQTYQTGADAWQLFALWAGLALPWAAVSRWSAAWLLELALVDTAIILFWGQAVGTHESEALWRGELWLVLTAIHGLAGAAASLGRRLDVALLGHRGFLRAVVAGAFFWLTIPSVLFVTEGAFMRGGEPVILFRAVGVLALAGLAVWSWLRHRRHERDLYLLTCAAGCTATVVTAALARLAFDVLDLDELGLLFMGLVIVAQIAGLTRWLRHEAQVHR